MRRVAVRMLLLVGLILLIGCATTPPARLCAVAYGTHGPPNKSFGPHYRFVVWGMERFVGPISPTVMPAVMETLQRLGHTVIEDARFEEVYNEHVRQHKYGFDDATVARVGKLVGADSILFVVTERGTFEGYYDNSLNYISGVRLTLTVRAVSLETGDVRWTGIAMTPIPVKNEDAWLRALAQAAVGRGGCPIERGFKWDNCEGCTKP
jgi:hypothetical protein